MTAVSNARNPAAGFVLINTREVQMKRTLTKPSKKSLYDSLEIAAYQKNVYFNLAVDDTQSRFKISKSELKGLIK